jgi:8-oxo-dGTP diphosphatase
VIEVVAGILRGKAGHYLMASRPRGKVYSGFWEFPGGKIEPGEKAIDALRRELKEELGVDVVDANPWIVREHVYSHARVLIRFFIVDSWNGSPSGLEGQKLTWVDPNKFSELSPLLEPNIPVMKALSLPSLYYVTNVLEVGFNQTLQALHQLVKRKDDFFIQVREKTLPEDELLSLIESMVEICEPKGIPVLINSDIERSNQIGVDGIHLTSKRLQSVVARPSYRIVGVSCHDLSDIRKAALIGADFIVLGPVKDTLTHPGAVSFGWDTFSALCQSSNLPVYGLGGLVRSDLSQCWSNGAAGVAMMRGAWTGE